MVRENPLCTAHAYRGAPSGEQEFVDLVGEIDAVADEDVVPIPIHVDVLSACAIGVATADRIEPILSALVCLPGFDAQAVFNLRSYALAAQYAHVVATGPSNERRVRNLCAVAIPLRDRLLVAADHLTRCSLLPPSCVGNDLRGQGNIDIANALIALASLYRTHWGMLHGKTAVTIAEVDGATVLGSQLHAAVGVCRVRMAVVHSRRSRERAFALFLRAYEECRRGVLYLRWHEGDGDVFAPSLYGPIAS